MRILLFILILSVATAGVAQSTDKTDISGKVGLLYEKELSVGGRITTNGWGVFVNYGKAVSYDKSKFYQIEFMEIKHPKETKKSNDFNRTIRYSPKPFVFGKQNSFFALHAGYGQKIFLGDKAEKSGVEVNLSFLIGPSLGILKPYYLDILIEREPFFDFSTEKYNAETPGRFLEPDLILGSSGFSHGLSEIKLIPGAHGKAGVNFDWANYNEFIRALEVGLAVDVYPKKIPIMIEESNNPYFIYLYLSLQFGKKW